PRTTMMPGTPRSWRSVGQERDMSGGTVATGAMRRVTCALAATAAVGAGSGAAQEFAPGNILVSHQDVAWEYTPDGQRVSTIRIPSGPWVGAARDLLIDDAGRLRLTIGSPHMYLLAFDPATG